MTEAFSYLGSHKYVEVCPEVHIRKDIREFPKQYVERVMEIMKAPHGRCFRSIYTYDKSYLDYLNENDTLKGYKGTYWADNVIIDFDDNDSVENARQSCNNVLRKLLFEYEVEPEAVEIYFTGNRGFHLSFPSLIIGLEPTAHMRHQMIGFLRKLIDGCFLSTTKFDESIYKANGLIRISGSFHEKGGLYKIPLTSAEFIAMGLEEIREMAKQRRPRPKYIKVTEINERLAALWPPEPKEEVRGPSHDANGNVLPILNEEGDIRTDQRMCMQRLMREDVKEGHGRNEIALRLASHHTSMGAPSPVIKAMMDAWNQNLTNPLSGTEIDRTVQSALATGYYFGCDDSFLSARCDTKCFKYKSEVSVKSDEVHIKTTADVFNIYVNILKQDRFVTFGLEIMDHLGGGLAPGECCFEVACSGVGKTTIMFQQAENVAKATGKPVLILEQELHDFLISERMIALACQKGSAEMQDIFKLCRESGDYSMMQEIQRDVEKRFPGVYICTLDQLNTKRKIELINAAKRKHGELAMVFEDYLGRGTEIGRDLYEITTRLAQGTKTAAKECDVPIISMVQARAEGGLDPKTPIDHNSLRDSRAPFIAGDAIFGFWRPYFGELAKDNVIRGRMLKTRRGREWRDFQLDWTRSTGEMQTDNAFVEGMSDERAN